MPVNLKRKPWLLPTRSVPALVACLLFLGGCPKTGCVFIDSIIEWVAIDTLESGPVTIYVNGTPEGGQSLPPITPVDQATLNPTRGGGPSTQLSRAVRAATSATAGAGTVVYLLDKFGNLFQFDPGSRTVVATLNFSQIVPQGIAKRLAVTPDRNFAFITVSSAQSTISPGYVLVADLNSFSIVSSIPIPLGDLVQGLDITPDGSNAYVVTQPYSGSGPSNVYVINVASRAITRTIPIPGNSNLGQIAITPDGTQAYLVNSIDSNGFSIPVLDLQSDTVQPSLPIYFGSGQNLTSGYPPSYIAMHPDGTRLYLAPVSGGPVQILSTISGMVTNTIPLPPGAGPVFGANPTFTADGIHLGFVSGTNLVVFVNTLTDTVESTTTLLAPPNGPIRNFTLFFLPPNR
jgi:DNA-binding beta-propeller fold protein YncE